MKNQLNGVNVLKLILTATQDNQGEKNLAYLKQQGFSKKLFIPRKENGEDIHDLACILRKGKNQ